MDAPDVPRLKLVEIPLLSLDSSSIDLAPLLGLMALFLLALLGLLYAKRKAPWRYATQLLSVGVFVLAVHRTMCVLRGWVFGIQEIGHNDALAFTFTHIAVSLVAIALVGGAMFCGWMCPVGAAQEHIGRLAEGLKKKTSPRTRFLVDMFFSLVAIVSMIYLMWLYAPENFFFSENVSAVYTLIGLSALPVLIIVPWLDQKLRWFRTVSLYSRLVIVLLGMYVTNPGCTLYETEVDYSAAISFLGVILGSLVLMRAYCKFICPFGALFGSLGTVALIKIKPRDTPCSASCKGCSAVCPMGALDQGTIEARHCIMCARCVDSCRHRVVVDLGMNEDEGDEDLVGEHHAG